jgi:Trypsin-co-occurring domain 1
MRRIIVSEGSKMTKRLIEYKMANGDTITAEVDEQEPVGVEPVSLRNWLRPQPAKVTFEEALDKVTPATTTVINKLSSVGLQKIEVEFGLKMNASAGVVIAAAGVEANYKITLTWEKEGR